MKKEMKRELFLSFFIVVALLLSLVVAGRVLAQPSKPKIISWSSFEIGSRGYTEGAFIGEGMLKKFGIKLRLLPMTSGVGRCMAIRTGTADFYLTSPADVVLARRGTALFSKLEWGPQALRAAWLTMPPSAYGLLTRGDSGIKTPADLKGKRVAWNIGSPSQQLKIEGYLHFGGLTWDDVKKVEGPSIVAGVRAVIDMKCDAAGAATTASYTYELEASPHGIHWIPIDPKNAEAIKFHIKRNPGAFVQQVTLGAGISKEDPVWMMNEAYPSIYCYDFLDEDIAYWQVKAIVESFNRYKDLSPGMYAWHIDKCLSVPTVIPWHDGAIRYFKEIGRWTDELQKAQDMLLEEERKAKKLWDATVDEAIEKGVKGKKFSAFWLEKRKALD